MRFHITITRSLCAKVIMMLWKLIGEKVRWLQSLMNKHSWRYLFLPDTRHHPHHNHVSWHYHLSLSERSLSFDHHYGSWVAVTAEAALMTALTCSSNIESVVPSSFLTMILQWETWSRPHSLSTSSTPDWKDHPLFFRVSSEETILTVKVLRYSLSGYSSLKNWRSQALLASTRTQMGKSWAHSSWIADLKKMLGSSLRTCSLQVIISCLNDSLYSEAERDSLKFKPFIWYFRQKHIMVSMQLDMRVQIVTNSGVTGTHLSELFLDWVRDS